MKKQLDKLEHKNKYTETRMKQIQAQSDLKLDEIDKLYYENDKLRNSLDDLRSKFDVE